MARKEIEPASEFRCDGCGTTQRETQQRIAEVVIGNRLLDASEYLPSGWMHLSLRQWVHSDGGVDGLQRDKLQTTVVDYCPDCKAIAFEALNEAMVKMRTVGG